MIKVLYIGSFKNFNIFSKDCLTWGLLPVPSKADIEKSMIFKNRLTGDPSYETEYVNIKQELGEGDEPIESEELVKSS